MQYLIKTFPPSPPKNNPFPMDTIMGTQETDKQSSSYL